MKRKLIAFLMVMLPFASSASAASGDYVVLLHGMGRTKRTMTMIARNLSFKGYTVINITYASRKKRIEELVEDVAQEIGKTAVTADKKIHFIGYSMGGLVARAYIHKYRPQNMGRVVLLGTPNQGSEVADFLSNTVLFKIFFGPAGQELVTDQTKFKKMFGTVDYDLGVIAGDRSIDPISSFLIIPGKNDGKVSVARTKIDGMKDHIVVHATHTFMPLNGTVIRQVAYFLEQGKFMDNSNHHKL